ncbi:MAG: hypothetical protein ACI379_11470 [Nocardioides sp.]|uniref:hypothetical protein n=1 Tax=Nocardioides sp. TaxID=35761 RepID=UPI003EFDCA8E
MTDPYATAPLECDLVMKGGVTSGIIYPSAVCELARTYRFRAVGGASAGAIAAAATAAAEYGRASGGFDRLQALPGDLTQVHANHRSTLFNLFQPARAQRRPFRVLCAHLLHKGRSGAVATGLAAARAYWARSAVWGVAVLGLAWAGFASGSGWGVTVAVAALLGLLPVGWCVLVGLGLVRDVGRSERFGLVTGMPDPRADAPDRPPALTEWLHGQLQSLSGRSTSDAPLTFADLDDAGVELRMMTTNLTRGQPTTMPWSNQLYYFEERVFRQLFPADVVDWMVAHPAPPSGTEREQAGRRISRALSRPLHPWPAPGDLPVLVAARMSLSFPGLIQAVPVHAADPTAPRTQALRAEIEHWLVTHWDEGADVDELVERARHDLEEVPREVNWFSDGGICTNLPVHMFDSPIPTRPTFAVNLDSYGPHRSASADEADNSYLAQDSGGGRFRPWRTLTPGTPAGLLGFGGAVLGTARRWVDDQQMTMPGYRGRVVTIFHSADEGGLNLEMERSVVEALVARGEGAGARLVARFAGERPGEVDAPGWTAHRWTRLRISLSAYQRWVTGYARSYADTDGARTTYPGLFELSVKDLTAYRPGRASRAVLDARAAVLAASAPAWKDPVIRDRTPAPAPVLRLTTELDESNLT